MEQSKQQPKVIQPPTPNKNVKTKSVIYTWGQGSQGQLGISLKNSHGNKNVLYIPTKVKGVRNITKSSTFTDFTMSLHEDGTVYGFGSNARNRLGFKIHNVIINVPTTIPQLVNIVKVDAGYWHSLALDQEGQAWSSGFGGYGELGRNKTDKNAECFGKVQQIYEIKCKADQNNIDSKTPKSYQQVPFKDIKAGFNFSLFISDQDSALYQCGKSLICDNPNKTINQVLSKELAQKPKYSNQLSNQYSDHVKEIGQIINQPEPVHYFKDIPIKQMDCGKNNVFVLTQDLQLYSWGDNLNKQLAQNDPVYKTKKMNQKKAILEPKPVKKDDSTFQKNKGKYLNRPRLIEYFQDNQLQISQVSCSKSEKNIHTACLTTDGRVFMWGDPYKGQIGLFQDDKGNTPEDITYYCQPLELDLKFLEHPPQLKQDPYADEIEDVLIQTDSAPDIPAQNLYIPDKVIKITCGGLETVMVTEQGRVYTCGSASDGMQPQQQFKEHNYFYRDTKPRYIQGLDGKMVVDVQCSADHFIALIAIPQE